MVTFLLPVFCVPISTGIARAFSKKALAFTLSPRNFKKVCSLRCSNSLASVSNTLSRLFLLIASASSQYDLLFLCILQDPERQLPGLHMMYYLSFSITNFQFGSSEFSRDILQPCNIHRVNETKFLAFHKMMLLPLCHQFPC